MGLNLETLITILVILIIGILADGVRRMLKERNTSLRLRIDPKARDIPTAVDDANPELPSGGARPVRHGSTAAHRQAPSLGNLGDASFDDIRDEPTPPLVMEPEEEPKPSVTAAVQVDLFASNESVDSDPVAAPSQTEPELLEVIVLHMVTSAAHAMPGRELLQALLEQGLRYGDMNIFHRHSVASGREELQFSMANALEPGTFDIDDMENQTFRAVTFFMKLPGPSKPADVLEKMVSVVRKLAERFSAELRDDQHSVLTQQTVEHIRQRVQDFERRSRVTGV